MSGAVNGIGYLHDAISTPIVRNTLVSGWLFYPHKVVKPLIYLVFCWTFIPAIIAFIEAIMAATKTADAYGNIEM